MNKEAIEDLYKALMTVGGPNLQRAELGWRKEKDDIFGEELGKPKMIAKISVTVEVELTE